MANEENGQEQGLSDQQPSFEQWLRTRPAQWLLEDYQKAHRFLMESVRRGEKSPEQAQQELLAMRQRLLAGRPELMDAMREAPLAEFAARDGSTPASRAGYGAANPLGNLNNGTAPGAPAAPGAAAAPAAGGSAGSGGGVSAPLRSLAALFPNPAPGSTPDFSHASDQELRRFFPVSGDADSGISAATGRGLAAANWLRAAGLDPTIANPWVGSALGLVEELPDVIQMARTVRGQGAGERDLLNDMAGVLGSGRASYFDRAGGQAYLKDLSSFLDRPADDSTLTQGQRDLRASWNDPKKTEAGAQGIFNQWLNAGAADLAPVLRNNSGLRSAAFKQTFDRWYNGGNPNQRFDQFLWGGQI